MLKTDAQCSGSDNEKKETFTIMLKGEKKLLVVIPLRFWIIGREIGTDREIRKFIQWREGKQAIEKKEPFWISDAMHEDDDDELYIWPHKSWKRKNDDDYEMRRIVRWKIKWKGCWRVIGYVCR